VVGKVHGRPPQPHCVANVDGEQPGKDVSHKQSLQGGPSGVKGGESAKDHGRGEEGRGVDINAGKLVDGLETGSVSGNAVVGRRQSVRVLIPRWGAWEDDLNQHSRDVHVAESACPDGQGARRTPNEHACADNNGRDIVYDSVRQPGKDVENGVLVSGQDVAQVGAVEDVLEGGEDADPDSRAVVCGNVSRVKLALACGTVCRSSSELFFDPDETMVQAECGIRTCS